MKKHTILFFILSIILIILSLLLVNNVQDITDATRTGARYGFIFLSLFISLCITMGVHYFKKIKKSYVTLNTEYNNSSNISNSGNVSNSFREVYLKLTLIQSVIWGVVVSIFVFSLNAIYTVVSLLTLGIGFFVGLPFVIILHKTYFFLALLLGYVDETYRSNIFFTITTQEMIGSFVNTSFLGKLAFTILWIGIIFVVLYFFRRRRK